MSGMNDIDVPYPTNEHLAGLMKHFTIFIEERENEDLSVSEKEVCDKTIKQLAKVIRWGIMVRKADNTLEDFIFSIVELKLDAYEILERIASIDLNESEVIDCSKLEPITD